MPLGCPPTVSIGRGYSSRNWSQNHAHKSIQNAVADVISRLDFGPVQGNKANWMMFTKCWCHYTMHAHSTESTTTNQHQMNMVFANHSDKDLI